MGLIQWPRVRFSVCSHGAFWFSAMANILMCVFVCLIITERKPVDSSSVSLQPTVKVTPSKPSVVIINNTLSSSRDVPGESGCYGKCDVARTAKSADSEVYACRGGQEAKKPIPAQRSEVSTCTKTGAAQAWRKADSISPLKPAHGVPTNNTKINVTEGKPADEEKRSRDGAEEKEMDGELHRRKRVRFEMNGENQGWRLITTKRWCSACSYSIQCERYNTLFCFVSRAVFHIFKFGVNHLSFLRNVVNSVPLQDSLMGFFGICIQHKHSFAFSFHF